MAKEKGKKVIFSNLKSGSNCHEGCLHNEHCECDYRTLEDERINLRKKTDGRILAIADVGRWNGRVSGYKVLGKTVSDILSTECDYVEWYADGRNIKATMHHHDGTNYIEYRVIREDRNIDGLLNKLYNQEPVTRQMINYYTKSLYPYVAEIYGW